jgi:hypothetical protein
MAMTEWFRQTLLGDLTATTPYNPVGLYLALFEDTAATTELTSPAPDLTDPQNPIYPPGYYRQVIPLPDYDPGADTTFSTSAVTFDIVTDVTVNAIGMCGSDVVGTTDVIAIKALSTPLVLTSGQTVQFDAGHLSLQLI